MDRGWEGMKLKIEFWPKRENFIDVYIDKGRWLQALLVLVSASVSFRFKKEKKNNIPLR